MQVVFTVLGAIPLFGQYPSGFFLLGAGMVTVSVAMYGATAEQSAVWCGMLYLDAVCTMTLQLLPCHPNAREGPAVDFVTSAVLVAGVTVHRYACYQRGCSRCATHGQ
jgi:hypothetical protein